jgi:hypothetical protein
MPLLALIGSYGDMLPDEAVPIARERTKRRARNV